MKKIFGGINLTYSKIIIMAVLIGIYTACSLLIPITRHTSFSDLGATFEVWIFFGIFIIMNSKSPKDSAIKCFLFFLISQPIIYLVQDLVEHTNLFMIYYPTWFKWTILCIPMGYIGYYMKKDKWWGLLILAPILCLLAIQLNYYMSNVIFSFPRHILTVLFCILTFIIYPLFIFKNKTNKIIGLIMSIILMSFSIVLSFIEKPVYSTEVLISSDTYQFDETCKLIVYDDSIGDISIKKIESIDDYAIHGEFYKEGKTAFELECPNGESIIFDLIVKRNTYDIKKRE